MKLVETLARCLAPPLKATVGGDARAGVLKVTVEVSACIGVLGGGVE